MGEEIIDIHIRVGTTEDSNWISKLGKHAFIHEFSCDRNAEEVRAYVDDAYSVERIEEFIQSPHVVFRVAEIKNELVGFSLLIKESPPSEKNQKALKMERLYLDPVWIGRGIGKELMLDSFEQAKSGKMDYLWLMVLRTNTRALAFYKAFGLKEFGQSPGKFKADAEIDYWMKSEFLT